MPGRSRPAPAESEAEVDMVDGILGIKAQHGREDLLDLRDLSAALMMTVPGLSTLEPSGYFCVMESSPYPWGY